MPVVFDSSGPVREMFESFAPQVMVDKKLNVIKVTAISQLRLPYNFGGVSRPSGVARPVYTVDT